jgi:hypothetical protein
MSSQLPLAVTLTTRPSVFFVIPVQTKNPSNQARGNSQRAAMAAVAADAKRRKISCHHTREAIRRAGLTRADLVPAVVTLTRVSFGKLDGHDGLPPALKRVVDGIAEALGIDDGGPFVRWQYAQRRGAKSYYAVEVTIERMR